MMKNEMSKNWVIAIAPMLIVAAGASILSSCGQQPYAEFAKGTSSQSSLTSSSSSSNSSGSSGSTGSTGSTGSSNAAAPSTSFTVSGGTAPATVPDCSSGTLASECSMTVTTDDILKVRITAGAATNILPNSNFSATYGCVTYKVSVLGQTRTTNTLSPSGGNWICPSAAASQDIDFSSLMVSGHGSVTVTVAAAGYDFYCQACYQEPWLFNAYYYGCQMYCPLHTVYVNHGVTGTLSVETNGTSFSN